MEKDINLNDKNEQNIKDIKNRKNKRERKEQKGKNNEAGITIITLAITILIIIILASITINAVLGDNGLLEQAQDAKDLAESTTLETGEKMNKVLQEYMNVMAEDEGGGITEPEEDTTPPTVIITEGEITENSIEISVTANDPESGLASENAYVYYVNGTEKTRNNSNSYTFTDLTASTQYTIKVEVYNGVGIKGEESITVSTSAKPGLSADEIQQNPTTYYWAEVKGYTCSSNGVSKWRIFYAGPTPGGSESNIYLIADDYIASEYAPTSIEENSLNIGSTNYQVYFKNILHNYSGSKWIISNTNKNAQKWLDTYLKSNSASANNNIQVVAYLMDKNKWNIYAGEKAEYAMGGPTIELFCASYKETHSNKYLQCDSVTSMGYKVKWNTDSEYNTGYISGVEDNLKEIYKKKDASKAEGMWLASPYLYNTLLYATYDGRMFSDARINSLDENCHLGLRPIVCLKPNVRLETLGEGIYAIVQ